MVSLRRKTAAGAIQMVNEDCIGLVRHSDGAMPTCLLNALVNSCWREYPTRTPISLMLRGNAFYEFGAVEWFTL